MSDVLKDHADEIFGFDAARYAAEELRVMRLAVQLAKVFSDEARAASAEARRKLKQGPKWDLKVHINRPGDNHALDDGEGRRLLVGAHERIDSAADLDPL